MPNVITDKLISWASDIENDTITQAAKTSRLPIIEGHVALMPDAHVGMGSTVGSVVPTKGAVIPSCVGVDIGCGMIASQLNIIASDLPDGLDNLLSAIERAIPAGVGQGHNRISPQAIVWFRNHNNDNISYDESNKAGMQFGTLGSGNHFFELCLDEKDGVWVVLHSGSRGIGNQLATQHITKAKKLAKEAMLSLEDPDLAYFVQGTPEFDAYISDMLWAQDYAKANRDTMMNNALKAIERWLHHSFTEVQRINCHHNFTEREVFDGKELWITRKGAIKAETSDLGVIPGSMGTRSYIVRGKSNAQSWNSCSHGAGRRMSRGDARRKFTQADLRREMEGKVWLDKRASLLIDEIPSSYKDIDIVMEDQKDLVSVEHVLHQILNYKGT